MYLVAGHFTCKEAGRARAVELMSKMVTIGRGESGVRQYTFYPDPDSDTAFFLFEEWESKAAHDVHFESEAMQRLVPEFMELLEDAPDVSYFDADLVAKL
jgi:quinol monooxygenase YgiN